MCRTSEAGPRVLSIQHAIVRDCEIDLAKYGDTFEGAGWTKKKVYADRRYQVMLDVIRPTVGPVSLLDFGCGASLLLDYIQRSGIVNLAYTGLDLSSKCLDASRAKFPDVTYYQVDILDPEVNIPRFDYIILNGVLTYKGIASHQEMLLYSQKLIRRLLSFANKGIAFNVTSKHVDWERDDLFHLSLAELATFVEETLGRRFVVRHDYDLFEFTTYVYLTSFQDEPIAT